MKIRRIAIIGGGTAGWLAANHLGAELSADQEIEITVIESKDIPTIGVGEGTVPYIMKSLQKFGISEAELLLTCDATFKQGIKFVNWLDAGQGGENHYYHPFDEPYPGGFDITAYWNTHARNRPFDDVGLQARVCEMGLAPKRKSAGEYQGDLSYAYHFDALKFANLLAKNAQCRFNVNHLQATIKHGVCNEQGGIQHLVTADDENLTFDFYVDCSGLSSILIDKTLQVPFVNKANELFTDTALVHQMPLTTDSELNPYTTATAHKAGWIWDIPLTSRRGTGFVYSSRHMTEDEAKGVYLEYLGIPAENFNPRKLEMTIGYRETFWQKNCVALGLAQGFLEPLEATSILLSDFSAELLARNFPADIDDISVLNTHYNQVITYVWERCVDFIKLHYCISDRQDSPFWTENRESTSISAELTRRLRTFQIRPPHQSDFFSRFDLFNEKNFLYVLYGMKFKTKPAVLSAEQIKQSQALLQSNDAIIEKAQQALIKQSDWLQALKVAMATR